MPNVYKMCIIPRRTWTFNKESIGAAFGRAPQGRGAPLWMLSLLNLMILCPDVDPVEEFAHFGSVGAILWMI